MHWQAHGTRQAKPVSDQNLFTAAANPHTPDTSIIGCVNALTSGVRGRLGPVFYMQRSNFSPYNVLAPIAPMTCHD